MSEPQYDCEDMDRYYDMKEFRDMQRQRDELLAALKAIERAYDSSMTPLAMISSTMPAVRAAIVKAEGR